MKILLSAFNAKVGRKNIFKLMAGNKSLHEISNDNGVRVVNFATPKNLVGIHRKQALIGGGKRQRRKEKNGKKRNRNCTDEFSLQTFF
jgi:hypothetical protein